MRRSQKQGVGMPDLQTLSVLELARSWKWPLWLLGLTSGREGEDVICGLQLGMSPPLPSMGTI